jgi:hypothetical protein
MRDIADYPFQPSFNNVPGLPSALKFYTKELDKLYEYKFNLDKLEKAREDKLVTPELDFLLQFYSKSGNVPQNDVDREEMMDKAIKKLHGYIVHCLKSSAIRAYPLIHYDIIQVDPEELHKASSIGRKIKKALNLFRDMAN